ncbi:hypothetical protein [Dokdonella koreensis]|uniref:Secreted protein n=1 Tax=Dokdonella koreensis DS-123 TaxID=1300342 RepID=A0A161HIV6_9GAMM|nr:hypothetical protein [Dokdonella koreensis]ANB16420.1 Hypothetical protein I596_383 [Dokdonella koreensis DS-123]
MKRHVVFFMGLIGSTVVAAATLDSSKPGSRPFDDGDTLLWGLHDGARCTGLCIRTERQGNVIVTHVHGADGELVKTDTHALIKGRGQPIPLSTFVSATGTPGDGSASPPSAGASGSVSQSQPYTSGKTHWMQTTTFHYVKGALRDVKVEYVQYTVP